MTLRTRIEGGGTPRPEYWGIDSEYGRLSDVLVGPIEHFDWQSGNAVAQRSERVGRKFDLNAAVRQHGEMVHAFEQAGVKVHRLAADARLPYQVFARDSSVMTPWGAVIMQLQRPFRRGEYAACLRFTSRRAFLYSIWSPPAMSKGAISWCSSRASPPAATPATARASRQCARLRDWFAAEGWEFHAYPFDPHFLHLDVQLGMLAPGLAVACVEAMEDELLQWLRGHGIRLLEVTYADALELGCNVVALCGERVLVPASSRRLIDMCRAEGLEVYDPDVSMISAGGGAVHCMCQALRRESVAG